MDSRYIVTLDGPAGVGKTTMARRVADALDICYLDTGAMFRTLALNLGEDALGLSPEDVRARAAGLTFSLSGCGAGTKLLCNGSVVGQEIRTEEVGALASRLAVLPVVRDILKEAQRELGAANPLVVEGRDMGTVVFPMARYKFFLDASPKVRALRRMTDLQAMGRTCSLSGLEQQIRERDERDRNRPVAPLRPAEDAFCIDTSQMTIDDVLESILSCIQGLNGKGAAGPDGVPELAPLWRNLQESRPLVHFITNVVIVNDCANITLACGASPIMADAPEEAAQVTSICQALVLNTGTINTCTALSMKLAGKTATEASHPVILDPVGAGISDLRNDILRQLMRDVHPDIIKGNISEVRWLAEGTGAGKGVDACEGDLTDEDNLMANARMAMALAARQHCVVVITGPIDIVADEKTAFAVSNGSVWMSRVSGMGCMTAAVTGSVAGANATRMLHAALAAVTAMGVAGEKAEAALGETGGTGTYRTLFMDAVSRLTPEDLDAGRRARLLIREAEHVH